MRILITGANRGLGLGLAQAYLERGDTVYATARDLSDANDLAALHKRYAQLLTTYPLNVADSASVDQLAQWVTQHLGGEKLDIVINNAGMYGSSEPWGELNFDTCMQVFNANTLGPLRVAQALGKVLRQPGSKLINMTSRMGSIADNSSGGSDAYRMSKAALNMASKNLSIVLKERGVAVAVMHPGWVQTRMGGDGATLTVEQSVTGMVRVIDQLTLEQTGAFLQYSGTHLPW